MIETIGVCGAGTMGSGIAQTAAMAGYRTILFDVNAEMVRKGRAAIEKSLAILTEKKKLTPEQQQAILERLSYVNDLQDCVADLIIEAIVEKPDIKLDLFLRLAALNKKETILTSNTSSLSLNALAGKLPYPGRFAGMHFFNPAPLMKLVEVVYTDHTDENTLQTIMQVATQMGKIPVRCKDAPGFIVNHVARPYYLEALRMVEQGLSDAATIDTLLEASGFRMGPFRLMDLIGNDINYAVSGSVYEAMGRPERLKPSVLQGQKVSAGELGRKTGKGWYAYDSNGGVSAASGASTGPSVSGGGYKVLVTGGTGFLGSYLIKELIAKGHTVRALRRSGGALPFYPGAGAGKIAGLGKTAGLEQRADWGKADWEKVDWFESDIRDISGLEEAMAGVNAVIHSAAKVSYSGKDRRELFGVNIEGTMHIVNAALEQGVKRFIHVSSVAALGRTAGGGEVTEEKVWEDSKLNTSYALSKFHGEMEVWRGFGEGLPVAIVNPSTLLGYGDWNHSSCALFRNAFREFPWYTEGVNGFVDVTDTARAVVRLLESDISGQRYILNGDNWSFRRLFEAMAAGFGKKPPYREATPFLSGVAWRMEKIKSLLTGRPSLVTRESARVAGSKTFFNNSKILRQLPDFRFTPLEETIGAACRAYLEQAGHQVEQAGHQVLK
jgi:3-hydroxyacyl-CoA dehydrogenase/nucleoside-diphosphate-sugar epimerase